jgi:hypothetical protein
MSNKTINLRVRYIGAKQPFVDPKANPGETLAGLKPRVLTEFKLTEGAANGGTKTYLFAHDGVTLTDANVTLETLAGGKHELKLDLLERFEQG